MELGRWASAAADAAAGYRMSLHGPEWTRSDTNDIDGSFAEKYTTKLRPPVPETKCNTRRQMHNQTCVPRQQKQWNRTRTETTHPLPRAEEASTWVTSVPVLRDVPVPRALAPVRVPDRPIVAGPVRRWALRPLSMVLMFLFFSVVLRLVIDEKGEPKTFVDDEEDPLADVEKRSQGRERRSRGKGGVGGDR
ncbi:hypothetical protein Hte_010309 [Hypoxylon texense]